MTRLIDDLLDATRLAHGKILLRKEFCDTTALVRQTVMDYQSIFEARNITLETEIPAAPIWVDGDCTRLVQAVGNLLHNAHKFTPDGGIVRLTMELQDHAVAIRVADNGIGIEAKMLPYIFDVFRQADQGLDRTRGGLGLGLALVKGLVELHGGTVSVKSEGLGKGTTFTIQLPVESLPAGVHTPVVQKEPPPRSEGCRVLLIEDNQLTAESTRLLLSDDGYDVQTAHTGPGALEMAHTFHPQIVLCDIGLPGMDGYQVVHKFRHDKELSSSYMIAMTGYGRDEDQRRAHEAGFDMHLTKPVDYNTLRQALANVQAKVSPQAS